MTFGEKLRQARKEANFSQEELAEKMSVSRSAIAKWETDKGMPDINNLKMMAQIMNISIDYLLDDGTALNLQNTREPIELTAYTDKKITVLNKKQITDKVIREKYPDAEIYTLMGEEKLTKGEKFVDTMIWLFSPMINAVKFSKELNNLDKEFYLVNKNDKQYFVVVTDEFIESYEMSRKMSEKKGSKFEIGNYKFMCCGPIIYA